MMINSSGGLEESNMNKLLPEFITFTGIDARTDLERADKLSLVYPIEWGVLLSISNKDSRYPCKQCIDDILKISGMKSAHLCGRVARDFQKGIMPEFVDLSQFDRIQVNGGKIDRKLFIKLEDQLDVKIITQSKSLEVVDSHLQLFDCSGGRGVLPESVPVLDSKNSMYGYAGGIGPDTVDHYLSLIKGTGRFWIDMESRIRTNGWFDLGKVERVCRSVFFRSTYA